MKHSDNKIFCPLRIWLLACILFIILLAACTPTRRGPVSGQIYRYDKTQQRFPAQYYQEVAEDYVSAHPDRAWVKPFIADRILAEKMNQREVRLSQGEPLEIETIPGTNREKWIMKHRTLYFQSGILQRWIKREPAQ